MTIGASTVACPTILLFLPRELKGKTPNHTDIVFCIIENGWKWIMPLFWAVLLPVTHIMASGRGLDNIWIVCGFLFEWKGIYIFIVVNRHPFSAKHAGYFWKSRSRFVFASRCKLPSKAPITSLINASLVFPWVDWLDKNRTRAGQWAYWWRFGIYHVGQTCEHYLIILNHFRWLSWHKME